MKKKTYFTTRLSQRVYKRDFCSHVLQIQTDIYFYIFSRAALNETFTDKYDGVLPRTP